MYQRSQAWRRFFENPREVRPPGRRQKGVHDSILLTKEIFRWMGDGALAIGTCRHPGGVLRFHQHRPCGIPNSITVSRDGKPLPHEEFAQLLRDWRPLAI